MLQIHILTRLNASVKEWFDENILFLLDVNKGFWKEKQLLDLTIKYWDNYDLLGISQPEIVTKTVFLTQTKGDLRNSKFHWTFMSSAKQQRGYRL